MYKRIVEWVKGIARPAPGASSREVRKAGALLLALGVAFSLVGLALVGAVAFSMEASSTVFAKLMMPVAVVGATASCMGGYRLVFGVEPEEGRGSVKRVLFGVAFIVGGFFCLVFAFVAVMLALYLVFPEQRVPGAH
jgi:hypothetical protein